jgi:hypothetical protein
MARVSALIGGLVLLLGVSATPAQAVTKTIDLRETGSASGPANDQCSFGYCTYYYNGTASGKPFGGREAPFSGAITGVEPLVNGCFSEASGSVSFLDPRTNILAFSMAVTGQLCIAGGGVHTFNGTFTIYDGQYKYANATGSGTISIGADTVAGTFEGSERGTISY